MLRNYIVKKSFWVSHNANVNWDVKTMGREGVGIPKTLLSQYRKITVTVESSGNIYMLDCDKALRHDKEWNTGKTAPKETANKFVIIPVMMMEFRAFTHEKQAKRKAIEDDRKERERLANMQTKLF